MTKAPLFEWCLFYSQKFHLMTEEERLKNVPLKGSLGLLALGYQGLALWRAKRQLEFKKSKKGDTKNEG